MAGETVKKVRRGVLVGVGLAVAMALIPTAGGSPASALAGPPAAPSTQTAPPKPRIVWKGIPFGDGRKAEMTAYSRIHYGPKLASWRLTDPKVIVEHYTASTTFSSAWNTFASDSPDAELGQKPGTCAHFIIDSDGTIYQLVKLDTRCRHTVGLNYTSIGIEMVGTSDGDIISRPRQYRAALALTRWLQYRFAVKTKDVIGHSESLSSPYHFELYGPWKTQTHGDWTHSDMQGFRRDLQR